MNKYTIDTINKTIESGTIPTVCDTANKKTYIPIEDSKTGLVVAVVILDTLPDFQILTTQNITPETFKTKLESIPADIYNPLWVDPYNIESLPYTMRGMWDMFSDLPVAFNPKYIKRIMRILGKSFYAFKWGRYGTYIKTGAGCAYVMGVLK